MGLAMTEMRLRSPAFGDGETVPDRHASTDQNLSPPLEWSDSPGGTRAYALFCHDPDAPLVREPAYGFVHWVQYNIPSGTEFLEEGSDAYTLGRNDYGRRSYDGPRPPEGHGPHRYYFWLLALDKDMELPAGLGLWDLLSRVESNVLGMSRLVGRYER